MLYGGDRAADVQLVYRVCLEHFKLLGNPVGLTETNLTLALWDVIYDCYDSFPGGVVERDLANPFKLAGWLMTCFLFRRPVDRPLAVSLSGVPADQDAVIAFNLGVDLIKGSQMKRNDGHVSVWDRPDTILSSHSFVDLILSLKGCEIALIDCNSQDVVGAIYGQIAVLLEQITYRAFPTLSYRAYMEPTVS